MDFNETLNLPKTEFPMRAGLPKREPEMLEAWEKLDLYHELLRKNEGRPLFILHDGPPFSNGNIHMGTGLNKCLKDFIIRYKNMSGFSAPYTPGWDNHGMPIESAIITELRFGVPLRLPGLCRALSGCPAAELPPARRSGRLGAPLQDHGATFRG